MSDTHLRILLVEDDEDDYLVTRRMLQQALGDAVTLTWIDHYDDALSVMRRGAYDLYLINYRLGVRTGLDLLHLLRQRRDATPAIFLTEVEDHEIDVRAAAAGAADYLVKVRLDASGLERAIRYARANAQMVDAVQASERRFRALIEHSADGIALLDPDYTIRYASPSTTRILGYTPEELIQHGLFDIVHPDDRAVVAQRIAASYGATGTTPTREVRLRHKDGTYRWLEYVSMTFLDDPVIGEIVVSYRDITERKRVEETLWLHERAIAVATSGIIITDARAPDLPIIYVNEGYERMTGYTAAESLGLELPFPARAGHRSRSPRTHTPGPRGGTGLPGRAAELSQGWHALLERTGAESGP